METFYPTHDTHATHDTSDTRDIIWAKFLPYAKDLCKCAFSWYLALGLGFS